MQYFFFLLCFKIPFLIIAILDLVTSDLNQNVESTSTIRLVAGVQKSLLDDINYYDSISAFAETVNDTGISTTVLSQCSSAIIKSQKLEHHFDF